MKIVSELVEIFKDICGYEGIYSVSNFGRIKRLKTEINMPNGSIRHLKERILIDLDTPLYGKMRYKNVTLSKNNIKQTRTIHRLVAETFIDNIMNKPCVNHKNGIKIDNRVENLEWVTHSENTIHSYNMGLQIPIIGEQHYNAKLSDKAVQEIRKSYLDFIDKLATEYNVSKSNIIKITRNNSRLLNKNNKKVN